VLCRHAETDAWADGRFCGRLDVGLSERGVEQAHVLASALAEHAATALYSSPLRRARETAEPIAARLRLDAVEEPGLAEVDFGALDGLTWSDAQQRFPHVYRAWTDAPPRARFPGGESYADVRVRASAAVARIRELHAGETVAVVSHGGPIRAIVADVLDLGDAAFRIAFDHGGWTAIEWWDDEPFVRRLNVDIGRPRDA
jgi:broad specificity phosphatase PhoE